MTTKGRKNQRPGHGLEAQVPRHPKSLMGKPVAQREWRLLCAGLQAAGLWDQCHLTLVELFCDAAQDRSDAQEIIRREGTTVPDGRGGKKRHPALLIRKLAEDRLLQVLAELGLTPRGRARVVGEISNGDPLVELLRRRTRGSDD